MVLASSSPRRKELLGQILDDFNIVASHGVELSKHENGPIGLVMQNAKIKAEEVAQRFPSQWILGADTLVWLGDQIFGKPKDMNEARDTLLFLSGRIHMVSTGLCLINQKENYSVNKVETSEVTFRELNEDIIENYFQEVDPLDKAGSYAIQTRPDLIIENFKGSHSNVVGLPVETVRVWFVEVGIL